jgi:hypothetical protein
MLGRRRRSRKDAVARASTPRNGRTVSNRILPSGTKRGAVDGGQDGLDAGLRERDQAGDVLEAGAGLPGRAPPAPFATRQEWLQRVDPGAAADDGAWLCDPDGVGPRLSLLRVPEPKVAKNRLHLDLRVAGTGSAEERWARITTEVDRLAAAGATVLQPFAGHHVVMADPEFCVC